MASQEPFADLDAGAYEKGHPIAPGDPVAVITFQGKDFAVKPKHVDHFLKTFAGSYLNLSKKSKAVEIVIPKEPIKSVSMGAAGLAGIDLFNAAIRDPNPLLEDLLMAMRYKGFNPFEVRLSLRALDESAINFLKQLAMLVGSRGTKMAKIVPKSNDREYVQHLVSISANLSKIHEDLTIARSMSCFPEYGLLGRMANSSLADADTPLLKLFFPKVDEKELIKMWLKASKANAKLTKTDKGWKKETMKQIATATLSCNWRSVCDASAIKAIEAKKFTGVVKPKGVKDADSDED